MLYYHKMSHNKQTPLKMPPVKHYCQEEGPYADQRYADVNGLLHTKEVLARLGLFIPFHDSFNTLLFKILNNRHGYNV